MSDPALTYRSGSAALPREAEADRILACYDGSLPRMMEMLERQFGVLHNRAQVLLALCGIIISTTGFSGRNVAGTGWWAQVLIFAGVTLVLLSAVVVCWGVLHLRWLTMQPGQAVRDWLIVTLGYRDYKTICYRVALLIMLIGLSAYVGAILIMLVHPLSAPNFAPR